MRSASLFAVAAMAVLMAASMFQPVAAYVGTLDQQQTLVDDIATGGLWGSPPPPQFVGQTFTAGLTGDLTEVDLVIGCSSSTEGTTCSSGAPVTVEIHSGSPTGDSLGDPSSLLGSALPNYWPSDLPSVFVTFTFSAPPAVVAGEVYAIVITTTQTHFYYAVGAGYEDPDGPYPYGTMWFTDAGGWHSVSDQDVAFKTYVSGPEEAEAVGGVVTAVNTLSVISPWLAVIGLVGCIGVVAVVAKRRRP